VASNLIFSLMVWRHSSYYALPAFCSGDHKCCWCMGCNQWMSVGPWIQKSERPVSLPVVFGCCTQNITHKIQNKAKVWNQELNKQSRQKSNGGPAALCLGEVLTNSQLKLLQCSEVLHIGVVRALHKEVMNLRLPHSVEKSWLPQGLVTSQEGFCSTGLI